MERRRETSERVTTERETTERELSSSQLNVALLNTHSANQEKLEPIRKLITDNNLDILLLDETWWKENDLNRARGAYPPDYNMKYEIRSRERGGGIAAIVRRDNVIIPSPENSLPLYNSIEYLQVLITVGLKPLRLVIMYRRPQGGMTMFYKEFRKVLEYFKDMPGELLLAGDLNVYFEKRQTKKMKQLLQDTGHRSHVPRNAERKILPTHKKGHTLDVVITRCDEITVGEITLDKTTVKSDHYALIFKVLVKDSLPNNATSVTPRMIQQG